VQIDPTGIGMVALVGAGYGFTRYRSAVKARQATTVARKGLLGMLPTRRSRASTALISVTGVSCIFLSFARRLLLRHFFGVGREGLAL